MKIRSVRAHGRRKLFEVETPKGTFTFPYVKAEPAPTPTDPITDVFVDPELGREAITFRLRSGAEGSIHLDAILEWNEDPEMLADLLVHRLTLAAVDRFEASPLSVRHVARRLGTSPTQLYRLLDPANRSKSVHQLIALLSVLGSEVDLKVRERRTSNGTRR